MQRHGDTYGGRVCRDMVQGMQRHDDRYGGRVCRDMMTRMVAGYAEA